MSDIDTVVMDSLKALDPNRPIREADIDGLFQCTSFCRYDALYSQEGIMTKEPEFAIPAEMRAMAEKSVAQAKQAFEGFMTAAQKAANLAEGQASTAHSSLPKGT